jgi:tetratricopeptide (TPR) repeat protein
MKLLPPLLLVLATSVASAQPAPSPAPPPGSPPADDQVARARQLYLEGKSHYDVGDYPKAIEIWKRAYVLSNAPMLLFNIAQAHRLSGDCATALKVYANYERESPNPTNKDELEQAKARCVREPTGANPPAEPMKPAPMSTAQPVEPSPPAVEPSRDLPPPPTRDSGRRLRVAGIATGVSGGALVIASLVLANRASSIASELEAYRGEWTIAQHARDQDGRSARTWSLATGIVGAAGLVAGGALYFTGRSRDRAPAVTVSITPTHAEVQWSASF